MCKTKKHSFCDPESEVTEHQCHTLLVEALPTPSSFKGREIYLCLLMKVIQIIFWVLFLYRLLQNIEYSPLWYIVSPCCLPILYMCCANPLSCDWLFAIPWTVAHQVLLSMKILQVRILVWVAMPSSRRSFQPRDWIQVSCIAGRFFTIWAIMEAPFYIY